MNSAILKLSAEAERERLAAQANLTYVLPHP